jgi:hypothetical protein
VIRVRHVAPWLCALGAAFAHADGSPTTTVAQQPAGRVWLAGRYNADHVVIYLDTLQFGNTVPTGATKLADPKAAGFFWVYALPNAYVADVRAKLPRLERIAIGDQFDLLVGGGRVITVAFDTLVGFPNDEGVGNQSYIGGLARVRSSDTAFLHGDYYVARRHGAVAPASTVDPRDTLVRLRDDTLSGTTQAQIIALLEQRAADSAGGARRTLITKKSQSFALADGSVRTYVAAGPPTTRCASMLAIVAREPATRIVSVDGFLCENDPSPSPLLRVVHLGNGRVGIIVDILGVDGRELRLAEYEEGVGLLHMRVLQSIASGE